MIGFGHNLALHDSGASIEDLASAELTDWFVWDSLVMAAYERSGGDRRQATALLARAISRLAEADDSHLTGFRPERLSSAN